MCLSQMSVAGLIREVVKEREALVRHTEKLQEVFDELIPYQFVLTSEEEGVHETLNNQLDDLYDALGLDR